MRELDVESWTRADFLILPNMSNPHQGGDPLSTAS